MTIKELKEIYSKGSKAKEIIKLTNDENNYHIHIKGLKASASSTLLSAIAESCNKTFIFILNDLEEAGYFYYDITQLLGDDKVLFFPSAYKRAIKYNIADVANEVLRTEAISKIQETDCKIVVTYPEAISEKVVSTEEVKSKSIKIKVAETLDINVLINSLNTNGFEYVDYVYEPGQYSVRGSIVDVYSYSSDYPYRIDFFGDEIDSIRTFDINSQLSVETKKSATILPNLKENSNKAIPFTEFIPSNSILVCKDLKYIKERICSVIEDTKQIDIQQEEAEKIIKQIITNEQAEDIENFKCIEFGNNSSKKVDYSFLFDTVAQPLYHKNFDLVADSFRQFQKKEYTIYICSNSKKQIDRIRSIFEERQDNISFTDIDKALHEGFIDNENKICLITDHQLFDRFHKYNLKSDRVRASKVSLSLKEINQFSKGDYVVHIDHGVGKFAGLMRIPHGDSTQEVIKLTFQNDDVVFVSIHSLHKVSKYKGKDGEPPRISKLGTGAWEKIKERTKKKIKDIARDLIKLYAKRKQEEGFEYSPDSFLQKELEASFLYEDTPDQSKATADVKTDMESRKPMDRLICGDVGFGKTEIAVRAAFKAVADNKQVAVLVPTTILAYQHFQTFRDRLKNLPCNVEYVSRARTRKEVNEIISKVENGEINILIGTHRILSKDIKFKDLGLLVIDEEQKFGVSVKEKLRQMRVNIDTLTLTATPIPRTLQFSLMGARDLSVLSTPPPNRYPIQTEIHTFNEDIIREAISFEMSRNGQVFFVNNRIANLEEIKYMITKSVPNCRVAIGHGQMEPAKLEEIISDFVNYEYDVLLATTIIESGIDISNANTIIINQAHNFGLSDLHQMRGRVGRSNKKAFCYLLAPPLATLPTESRRRLQAIENFSDLGSGIHIAMQDLDIRGAGNLLGAEQSGFIADLGYETYQKILAEAITELRKEEFEDLYSDEQHTSKKEIKGEDFVDECQIESDLELLFPDSYIKGSSERMLLYREMNNIKTDRELEEFRAKLIDRFGKIPKISEELLQIVYLRRYGKHLGIDKIALKSNSMILYFINELNSIYYQSDAFGKCIEYAKDNIDKCKVKEQKDRIIMNIKNVSNVSKAVDIIKRIDSIEL